MSPWRYGDGNPHPKQVALLGVVMLDRMKAGQKMDNLVRNLGRLDSLLVAFSGGVDSTFLLAVAHEILSEKVVAVTASSVIHAPRETKLARAFTRERGIHHIIFPSEEIILPDFVSNGPDRCYHCKRYLLENFSKIAVEQGLNHMAHGANLDDLDDYRPGFRAAEEAGVIAPLIDAQLTKEEIRHLSREMGLPTWNKPPMPCLASRIPYGSPVTVEKLGMIQQAEAFLIELGFTEFRVRHHGSVARIETDNAGFKNLMDDGIRESIVNKFRMIGFNHIALDLEGYVLGSLNRTLSNI